MLDPMFFVYSKSVCDEYSYKSISLIFHRITPILFYIVYILYGLYVFSLYSLLVFLLRNLIQDDFWGI